MAFVRLSKAQRAYTCANCANTIPKGHPYYRVEPHPMARYRRGEETKHICQSCAGGRLDASGFVKDVKSHLKQISVSGRPAAQQLSLWDLFDEPIQAVKTEVHVVNITHDLIARLIKSPNEINNLTPKLLEELVSDRLQSMGFYLERVGGSTFHKDGGIDIVACSSRAPFPFLMAVQVKHHKSPEFKTGPDVVRDLLGVIQYTGFNVGVVVTNTTFTPDAKWVAAQRPMLIRLRDIKDIRRWLTNDYLDEFNWQEIPDEIEVCPGVIVRIPKLRQ
jgi:hypothetical protein